jgi:hypothetical protein
VKGITIRHAVAIAIEGLNGEMLEWVVLAKQRDAMRKHVMRFVHDYARNRGVILSDADITSELDKIVAELRAGKPLTAEVRS